jgi:hypothetical protein
VEQGHPLIQAALKEVADLHAFFEAWFSGTAANTPAVFSRLETTLAEGFTMVSPNGIRLQRHDVIGWLRGAHGTQAKGPFRIGILESEVLLLRPPLVSLGYVEEQGVDSVVTRRRSTAVFEAVRGRGTSVRWLTLHETWITPGR